MKLVSRRVVWSPLRWHRTGHTPRLSASRVAYLIPAGALAARKVNRMRQNNIAFRLSSAGTLEQSAIDNRGDAAGLAVAVLQITPAKKATVRLWA